MHLKSSGYYSLSHSYVLDIFVYLFIVFLETKSIDQTDEKIEKSKIV